MKKSLIALAFGTLGLGIAEYVMMGILPYVATDLNISIAQAGHMISAYAIGVCIGAPILVLARKIALKRILLILATIMAIGNLAAIIAPDYGTMLLVRMFSGLPHGAYFGVASIVADKLADKGKGAEAVSIMIAGMTIANLFGVPLGTALSVSMSWRVTFMLAAVWNIITLYYIWRWVPQVPSLPDSGLKGQFAFLKKPAPWLLLLATMLGNGGAFCWYSYISPLLTNLSGFQPDVITLLMILAGAGMVVGNLTGGRLSDRYSPGRVAALTQGAISILLLLIFFFGHFSWASVSLMFLCTTCLFLLSAPQQLLIIRYSKGGELLGAASIQVAFNMGNAIGAYAGGLPLEFGHGYQYTALVGVPFALVGYILLIVFCRKYSNAAA